MSYNPELPSNHPSQPEEQIPDFDIASVLDTEVDKPSENDILPKDTLTGLPPIVLGCAPFGYGIYTDKSNCLTDTPLRIVRLALRSGITAFDTSPHYHPSEIILGKALAALKVPRESYQLITKAGKYGPLIGDHHYKPEVIRASVERSLKRLKTDYLDVVYLHDIEFVVDSPFPCPAGNHSSGLTSGTYDLPSPLTSPLESLGPGDDSIISSFSELRKLQSEGKIRRIGLAGYPLPILLRLSLLILHKTGRPVDIVQTYAHQTLQNTLLTQGYLDALTEIAKVDQVVNAAPLAMGILTSHGGPAWHPARKVPEVWDATREAVEFVDSKAKNGKRLEHIAISFGYRKISQNDGKIVPVVIGCKDLGELRETLKVYAMVQRGEGDKELEEEVKELFRKRGVSGWSY